MMSNRGAEAMVQPADAAFEPIREVARARAQVSEFPPADADQLHRHISDGKARGDLDETDIARMEEYALLAALLRQAPDQALLEGLSELRGNATPLGAAHAALAQAAAQVDPEKLDREFFELFIGVGRGELLPYGSYYLTGFLNERPLARLRDDLRMFGIVRTDDQTEPEDHAAILCEIMAGLAGGSLTSRPEAQRRLFEKHLAPWIGRFFADLEQTENSEFYRCVGTVGRLFIEIETEAFALPS